MNMMNALACFSLFAFVKTPPKPAPVQLENLTFNEAAQQLIPPTFSQLLQHLRSIGTKTLPHQVKKPLDLRKEVLKVRDYLDIFAYAMPEAKINKKDAFERLRQDLDEGYAVLGSYKDLFDVQGTSAQHVDYDKHDVKKRKAALLKWRDGFLARQNQYVAYLSFIESSNLVKRDRDDLSSFYWGATELRPLIQLSAHDNLNLLLKDLLLHAIEEWPLVRQLKNPARDPNNIEVFHDFRKRVRTLVKVTTYFPELVIWKSEDVAFLQKITRRYGVISDQVAKIVLLEGKGKAAKVKELKDETKKLWEDLQAWEEKNKVEDKLASLLEYF